MQKTVRADELEVGMRLATECIVPGREGNIVVEDLHKWRFGNVSVKWSTRDWANDYQRHETFEIEVPEPLHPAVEVLDRLEQRLNDEYNSLADNTDGKITLKGLEWQNTIVWVLACLHAYRRDAGV
jgi:hypothetical protein